MGAVLHEMLTGAKLFDVEGAFAVMRAHVEAEPALPSARNPKVPAALDEIVRKAVAKDPAMRFQSADEFRPRIAECGRSRPRCDRSSKPPGYTPDSTSTTASAVRAASASARRNADSGGVRHTGHGPLRDSIFTGDGTRTRPAKKDASGRPATGSGSNSRGAGGAAGPRRGSASAYGGAAGDRQTSRRPTPPCIFLRTGAPPEQIGEKLRDPRERSRPSAGGNPAIPSTCCRASLGSSRTIAADVRSRGRAGNIDTTRLL